MVTNAILITRSNIKYSSDEMDVNQMIKVKKIAGGTLDNNRLIRGVVFRKNFISKKMKREFDDSEKDPLLLLFLSHLDMEEKDKKYSYIL